MPSCSYGTHAGSRQAGKESYLSGPERFLIPASVRHDPSGRVKIANAYAYALRLDRSLLYAGGVQNAG